MHLHAICPIQYTLQYGKDPAELDAAPEASQALNFSFERYAPHLPALRAARTEADIKELGALCSIIKNLGGLGLFSPPLCIL